jgi:hypothetical protein
VTRATRPAEAVAAMVAKTGPWQATAAGG